MNNTDTFIPGLNRNHESRPLRACHTCGRQIVLCKSARTGKFYPVNVVRTGGRASYVPTDFHKCGAFGREEPTTEVQAPKTITEVYTEMLETETDPIIIAHLHRQLAAVANR